MPSQSHHDGCHEDRAGNHQVAVENGCIQALEDWTNLQSDENKGENIQHENNCFPDRIRGYAYSCWQPHRSTLCDGNSEAHHRQNSRKSNVLGDDPHGKHRDELKDDRGWYVLYSCKYPDKQPSERRPHDDATYDSEQKSRSQRPERKLLAATAPTASL